jgi:DNA-binding GntR family transcriptional regulator
MLDRIEVNSHEPVARRVFRELRNAIVTMGVRPGQALSEQEIATRLGVSRQPVREAFIKLSEAGLLTIRPQRGTFIVKISMKQVFDARFVREAVELAVVRRACAEMTPAGIEVLRANLEAQHKAAADLDPVRFMELDEAFHRDIALGVDCEYAWRVVEETKAQMDRVRYLSLPHVTHTVRLPRCCSAWSYSRQLETLYLAFGILWRRGSLCLYGISAAALPLYPPQPTAETPIYAPKPMQVEPVIRPANLLQKRRRDKVVSVSAVR